MVEADHVCQVEGSDGECWLRSADPDAEIPPSVAWSMFRGCLSCETLHDFVNRADGRRNADRVIGKALSAMLTELRHYDLQLQQTSTSLRRRVSELTLLNLVSDALSRTSDIDKAVQLFLIGVTAGGAGGLNRAVLFLLEENDLAGHTGVGHLSREEGQRTWLGMAESGAELQDLIDRVFAGSFQVDPVLNSSLRQTRMSRAMDSPLNTALNSRSAVHVGAGAQLPGHPLLDSMYQNVAYVIVPLCLEQDEVGVLVADNFLTGLPILEETVNMLQTLANQAAAEIMGNRLHKDLERQLQETEHLYELLRENQNYLLKHERLVDMGKLATTVAHEIKTPLVAIGGFARRAQRAMAENKPPLERDIGIIIREVSRLERITTQILDYSKEVKLRTEKVDLRDTLDEALEIVESRLAQVGILVEKHYAETACHVKADPRRMKQVILNLLENAIEAVSQNETPQSDKGHVYLRIAEEHDQAVLEVEDTGPGVPEDHMDRIFTPFFTTKVSGSGLGLPVTKRIVTDHGGRITLSRTPEGRTQFRIEMPRWTAEATREENSHVTNTGG
jgi:signal transduction histidine kinase